MSKGAKVIRLWRVFHENGGDALGEKIKDIFWRIFFFGFGLFMLLGALASVYQLCREVPFQFSAVPVTGVVESLDYSTDRKGYGYTTPTIRYTADGQERTLVGPSEREGTFAVGDQVQLLYSSKMPEHTHIDSIWEAWLKHVLTFVGGCFMAWIILIKSR